MKTKVLIIIPTLQCGGAERVIVTLLKYFDYSKFDITLLVVDLREQFFLDEIPKEVNVVDLSCNRVRESFVKIMFYIFKLKPNVIFSILSHMNIAMSMIRPFFSKRIKFIGRETSIVSIHNNQTQKSIFLSDFIYKNLYKNIDVILCQSEFMLNDLVNNYYIDVDKCRVIYNPVDISYIRNKASENLCEIKKIKNKYCYMFIAVGRLEHEKGYDILIDTLELLNRKDYLLVIIGEGSKESELKKRAFEKNVHKQIYFVGHKRNPYNWIYHADALILSSYYEGLPNVVLEALACQTPVISTPAPGGIFEILNRVHNSVIAKSIDHYGLADAINKWIELKDKSISQETINNYDVNNIVKQYEGMFLTI